jgi:hypothetical protein
MKQLKEVAGWYIARKQDKYSHYVTVQRGELLASAECGMCLQGKQDWLRPENKEPHCPDCVVAVQRQARAALELTRGLVGKPPEDKCEEKADGDKYDVNFLQVVGPEIPLCWIPVDDVKAVVMLLAMHQPKSESLRVVQAQFKNTIAHLNQYIDEAIERAQHSAMGVVTWTKADAAPEKGRKKK